MFAGSDSDEKICSQLLFNPHARGSQGEEGSKGVKQTSLKCFLTDSCLCLTQPQYRKLGTNEWLSKPVFKNLLLSLQRQTEDLQGLNQSCLQVNATKQTLLQSLLTSV